jgi:hypothetical protein
MGNNPVQESEASEVAALMDAAKAIPPGQKPPVDGEMYKAYHPQVVEAGWYDW